MFLKASTRATTVITTKSSMFTIKQTKATTVMTYTTPMTKSANLVTTILGSTSAAGSSTRRQTPNTIPTTKYINTMNTSNTTLYRPGLFRTVQTSKMYLLLISLFLISLRRQCRAFYLRPFESCFQLFCCITYKINLPLPDILWYRLI